MLNPYLLWFLPLAAAPLLLHLLTLRRLRTVELSTFRFLLDSFVQQRRRLKLLEYLVLALRVAFVAFRSARQLRARWWQLHVEITLVERHPAERPGGTLPTLEYETPSACEACSYPMA